MSSRSNPCSYLIRGQKLLLLPEKVVFWEDQRVLLVSDLHLGKVGHFRKAGIAIPKSLEQEDLGILSDLISEYKPLTLLILGDFFHSKMNEDWHWITLWRNQFKDLKIVLVKGNHDIIPDSYFLDLRFEIFQETYFSFPFVFTHHPPLNEESLEEYFQVCGHIHPSVSIRGLGGQSRRLPCFYFFEKYGILPAFGRFTGNHPMKIDPKAKIFIVSENSVIPVPEKGKKSPGKLA